MSTQSNIDDLESYRERLLAAAKKRLRNDDAAKDAVQETLIRAVRKFGQYDVSRPLWGWLASLLHNIITDSYRNEKARSLREQGFTDKERIETFRDKPVITDRTITPAVPPGANDIQDRIAFELWVESLCSPEREVTRMLIRGYVQREIASALNLSEDKVFHTVKKIRRQYIEYKK